jgi:hypothetical protein
LVDGIEVAKKGTLEFLETFKTPFFMGDQPDREILEMVARTTIRTKVVALYFIIFLYKQMHTYILLLSSQDCISVCSRLILAGMSDC